jgi:hypothetical protein
MLKLYPVSTLGEIEKGIKILTPITHSLVHQFSPQMVER